MRNGARNIILATAFTLLFLFSAGLAQSQTIGNATGSGNGFVLKESDGQPILRARVDFVLASAGWSRSTLTGRDGKFSFAGLSPVIYEVTVTAPGYEKLQLQLKVDEKSAPSLLRLRPLAQDVTPVNNSVVSVAELRQGDKAEGKFEKGIHFLQAGDFQKSILYFQAAIARDPTYYRAHHNLALAYYQLGEIDQAEDELQASITLTNGGYAPSEFALAMILCEKHDYQHAEQLIERGLDMEPGSALGKYFQGLVQFALDRLPDAERSANDALQRNARQADAHILLARIHERTHRPQAVMSDVSAYLAAEPSGPLVAEANDLRRRAQNEMQQAAAQVR